MSINRAGRVWVKPAHDEPIGLLTVLVSRHERENSSASTLPPESTTATTFVAARRSCRRAVQRARPPRPARPRASIRGTRKATARPASSSVAVTPSPIRFLLISNVSSPGACAISASQIEPVICSLCSRLPVRNERRVIVKSGGLSGQTSAPPDARLHSKRNAGRKPTA